MTHIVNLFAIFTRCRTKSEKRDEGIPATPRRTISIDNFKAVACTQEQSSQTGELICSACQFSFVEENLNKTSEEEGQYLKLPESPSKPTEPSSAVSRQLYQNIANRPQPVPDYDYISMNHHSLQSTKIACAREIEVDKC